MTDDLGERNPRNRALVLISVGVALCALIVRRMEKEYGIEGGRKNSAMGEA
jgi:hypothetical protein